MQFVKTPLEGAYLIDLEKRQDHRGFFARFFCMQEFETCGLETHFKQVNNSFSLEKGTLRGIHYQLPPKSEAKLVRCIQGALFDVIVDLRPHSPTFLKWYGAELSAENRRMMYVPKEFGHAFLTLKENTEALYFVSETYSPLYERGLRWDDPAITIEWPTPHKSFLKKIVLIRYIIVNFICMHDLIIIGAGIIGLSTALNLLLKQPQLKLLILEKEAAIASHQTGHNSGVIHSGIYYKPGSLKALHCRRGVEKLLNYCLEKDISVNRCGKVIVATDSSELPRLDDLYKRGIANGVPFLKRLSTDELKKIEPHVRGIAAIHSPSTAIVDYMKVAHSFEEDIRSLHGEIHLNEGVFDIKRTLKGWTIHTSQGTHRAKHVINCAGCYADRIAHLADPSVSPKQIIPFRGEFYELIPQKRALVNGLIYPVPEPQFPFLGVHLSPTIDGRVEAGPNAVLALSREGYFKTSFNIRDCYSYLTYRGFWVMAKKHWRMGCFELCRSWSKGLFLKSLQRLMPILAQEDLIPAESGVRAQVVLPNGDLQDDFLIQQKEGLINVLNTPSPAATASLAIGETLANLVTLDC